MEMRSFALFCILLFVAGWCGPTTVTARPRGRPTICLQPPPRSEGVCTIEIEGFYFDPRTSDCQMYVLGGCRTISGQSFGLRQDCMDTCVHMTRHIQDLRIYE